MSGDSLTTIPPQDQMSLLDDLRVINLRLERLEEKLDEQVREDRSMIERLDQILAIVVGTRRELREANRELRCPNIYLPNPPWKTLGPRTRH